MKNLSKCQEMMTIQQKTYLIICTIKYIIGVDLSRQTNTTIPQKIKFIGKLEGDNGYYWKAAKKLF